MLKIMNRRGLVVAAVVACMGLAVPVVLYASLGAQRLTAPLSGHDVPVALLTLIFAFAMGAVSVAVRRRSERHGA
jgi:hypothetical protein